MKITSTRKRFFPSSLYFFFSSRRRHTRLVSDWSSDVCSSDLGHETCLYRFVSLRCEPALCQSARHRPALGSICKRAGGFDRSRESELRTCEWQTHEERHDVPCGRGQTGISLQ